MNILLTSREALFPNYGGHREYLLSTVRQLSSLGHLVTIISWGPEDDYEYFEKNLVETHFKTVKNPFKTESYEINPKLRNILSSLGAGQVRTIFHKGLKPERLKNFGNFELVIKNGPDSNSIGEYVAQKLNVPIIERLDWVGIPYRSKNYKIWLKYIGKKEHTIRYHTFQSRLCCNKIRGNVNP